MRKLTKICCVCQRVKQNSQWRNGVLPGDAQITHGYCPDCFAEALADIEAYMVKQSCETARHCDTGLC